MSRLIRALLPLILALTVTVAGCSSHENEPMTIHLDITAAAPAEPAEEQVPLGSLVTLEVASEVGGLLHVHGYEEKLELTAGDISEVTFKASMAGVFEVETHDPDAVWIKLVVS